LKTPRLPDCPHEILISSRCFLAACDTTVKKSELPRSTRPAAGAPSRRSATTQIRLATRPRRSSSSRRPQSLPARDAAAPLQGWGGVWVNDKNKQGAFEGFYPMSVLIRSETIAHVNGGPDDDNMVGNRYAREHCEQLGAPFKK
jgi:hypothetical protein